MTTEAFEKFRTQVNADKALQASVAACFSSAPTEGSTGLDKLAALGRSHGFEFTAQDAQGATAADGTALSDFELELVSAGSNAEAKAALAKIDSDIGKMVNEIPGKLDQFARGVFGK